MSEGNAQRKKLFGGRNSDSHLNACISEYDDNWETYSRGYSRGADLLAKEIIENDRYIDTLIFPLIYLCRHNIELRLKMLVRDCRWLLDKEPIVWPEGHFLDELWKEARPMVEEGFKEHEDPEDAPPLDVEPLLNQFVAMDKHSTTFRYPLKKGGKQPSISMYHINVGQFWEGYAELLETLDNIHHRIRFFLDYKLEMESEMRYQRGD
jgi:hypothetical protein